MKHEKREAVADDLVGKMIGGLRCHSYRWIRDVLIVRDDRGNAKAMVVTPSSDLKSYTIDDEEVQHVQVTNDEKMFLLHTTSRQYLVNEQNEIVEDSSQWEDCYFDELTNSIYRKDKQGHWFDIQGFKLKEPVFLKGDVLTSLQAKRSRKSLSFKHQQVYISNHKQLIQVGKLVMDWRLEIVKYFGEKITALGPVNVAYDGEDVLQEVRLGLDETAFINEYSHEPYTCEGVRIVRHTTSYQYGLKRVDIFESATRSYAVEGSSSNLLMYEDRPLEIIAQEHISINGSELVKVSDGRISFYYDLYRASPLSLPALDGKSIATIHADTIRVGRSRVFNVATAREHFAIYEQEGTILRLDDGAVTPQRVEDTIGMEQHFGYAVVDGQRKLFSKKHLQILRFGRDEVAVSEIVSEVSGRLVNALDTNGNKLVLDLREGFDAISLALAEGSKVLEVFDGTLEVGQKKLQNVSVETLGGAVSRVVDVNVRSLTYARLPSDLKQYSDQSMPSVFAGSLYCELRFADEVTVEDRTFLSAQFLSFSGRAFAIILEKESGSPLHLQGAGFRNELATAFVPATISKHYHVGRSRMLGVRTISEDLKEGELLFSVQQMASWLSFFDTFLPVFRQVIEVPDTVSNTWNYHLLEVKDMSKDKGYVAVEKVAPYRVLADKKGGAYVPRVVKSKSKSIRSPEELTSLQRLLFVGSGALVEVE